MGGNIFTDETIKGNFTMTPNSIIRNNNISARAKGVYLYIMSLPPKWSLKLYDLPNHFSEGRDAIKKAFKELEENGYIAKKASRDDDCNQFTGWDYQLYGNPIRLKAQQTKHQEENIKDYIIQNTTNVVSLIPIKNGNSNFHIGTVPVGTDSSLDDLNKIDTDNNNINIVDKIKDNIDIDKIKDNIADNKIKDKSDNNKKSINLFDINKDICTENAVIKYWNKKVNVVKHLNQSTKLYAQTDKIIKQILKGTYKPVLNKGFMLDNKLKNLFKAPVDIMKIVDMINLFDTSLDPEYTGDKTKSPKSLKDFFCNRNGYSSFLYIARHGISKRDSIAPSVFFNYLDPVFKPAVSKLINQRMPNASDATLSQIYVKALNTQKEMLRLIAVFKSQAGSPYTTSEKEMVTQWIAYIERLPELYPATFDTGTIFNNFVNHVEQLHGVNAKYVAKKKKVVDHKIYSGEELYGNDDFDDLYK